MIECFLTNLYSIDVMAPFCLEMKKRGIDCHLALDELFWKISYGEHFDIKKAVKKAKEWDVKLNLRLNYNSIIAVTQWRVDWALFGLYKNLKAYVGYGIGLNKYTHFASNDYRFDLYFIHGDYQKELLLKKGIEEKRIIKIGHPKLDYQNINFKIKKTKKVATYLPTWDEFNCIDMAIEKLLSLKREYDVFVKPHPLQKEEDLKKLSIFNLLDKEITIKSIVNFSDIIMGDLKSGAIFEVIYYDCKKEYIFLAKNLDDFEIKIDNDLCKLKNYLYGKDKNFSLEVNKISPLLNISPLEIYKERLEKYYREFYEN